MSKWYTLITFLWEMLKTFHFFFFSTIYFFWSMHNKYLDKLLLWLFVFRQELLFFFVNIKNYLFIYLFILYGGGGRGCIHRIPGVEIWSCSCTRCEYITEDEHFLFPRSELRPSFVCIKNCCRNRCQLMVFLGRGPRLLLTAKKIW